MVIFIKVKEVDYMICPGCGKEIKEAAKFCPYCGSQIASKTTNPTGTIVSGTSSTKTAEEEVKSVSQKVRIGIVSTILVLAILVASVTTIMGRRSRPYEKDLAQMVDFLNQRYDKSDEVLFKLNTIQYMAEEDWETQLLDQDVFDYENSIIENYQELYETLDYYFGSDYRIEYNIIRRTKMKASELQEWKEIAFQDRWNFDSDTQFSEYSEEYQQLVTEFNARREPIEKKLAKRIAQDECTKGYKLLVRFSVKGEVDENTIQRTIFVIKLGDVWNTQGTMKDIAEDLFFDKVL